MRSYAKINVFLKITGTRGNYHEICSRFLLIKDIFDEISFIEAKCDAFTLEGEFSCSLEQNTIYKAFQELLKNSDRVLIEEFFKNNKVVVSKNIKEGSGLGGGSSNAATFLLMCNEQIELGISKDELANIGAKIGADVPFFIYGYDAANVSGIGEIVEPFDDDIPALEVTTPNISCNTKEVYVCYREKFFNPFTDSEQLKSETTIELLENHKPIFLNDLYAPARLLYPEITSAIPESAFFSGSGSSYFQKVDCVS